MSTTAKVALGVAAVAIVYFVIRARAAANQANYYTTGTPPPAPAPYISPPSAGPAIEDRSGRGHF